MPIAEGLEFLSYNWLHSFPCSKGVHRATARVHPLRFFLPSSRPPCELPWTKKLREALSFFARLHPGPYCVLEGDGAVEDGPLSVALLVGAEVPQALELDDVSGFGVFEAGLELAAREDFVPMVVAAGRV